MNFSGTQQKKEHLIQKYLWKAQVCQFFKIHFTFQVELVKIFLNFKILKVHKGHEIY